MHSKGQTEGNRLARLREAQGLSQRELAAKVTSVYGAGSGGPVQDRTIKRWEEGGAIPQRHWAQLADIFGVSIAYLLGLDADDDNGDGDGDGGLRSAAA